jgi:chromosome segregation ATPase
MEWTDWLMLLLGVVGSVIAWLFNRTIAAHDKDMDELRESHSKGMDELKESHKELEKKREQDLVHIFGKLSESVDSQRKLTEEIHHLHRTLLENYVRRDDLQETTRRFESAVNNLAKELTDRISELKADIREERRVRQ